MKKIKEFLAKYHVVFFITTIMSIYFLITEIMNFVEVKSAISMFTIILYISSITYVCLMEYFEWKKKDPRYSYQFTFYYLLINTIILPLTLLVGNITDSLNPVYMVSSRFSSDVVLKVMLVLYIIYLLFKFIKPIIKAKKAKGKNDHYSRCSNYGDIISGLLTLISSFFGILFIDLLTLMDNAPLLNVREVPFILSSIIVWIVTLVLAIKCGLGIRKVKKENKVQENE